MAAELSGLQPAVRDWVELTCKVFQLVTGGRLDVRGNVVGGTRPTITSTLRSNAEQVALRRLWELSGSHPYPVTFRGQTVYPANNAGDSSHNYGLGWDSDVPDELMPLWRTVREWMGWELSYPPGKDDVHANWPNWRQIAGL